uniref:SH2 domain-containing protein n=1 Tax=Sinocyclocheilus grahami TaxID=75366 RepID=A0A672Q555_SINGR
MEHPAYHGPISKQRCEELLGKKGRDGTYLIRDSETIQGALCLCKLIVDDFIKDAFFIPVLFPSIKFVQFLALILCCSF